MTGTLLLLAAPAAASTTEWPGSVESPPVQQAAAVVVDGELGASALHEVLPGGGLPFAPPDVAVLVLGGLVVTLAAAMAPLLLHLPRLTSHDLPERRTARAHG